MDDLITADTSGRCSSLLRKLVLLPMAVIGGWMLYSRLLINHAELLPKAIPAERTDHFSKRFGKLSYYADTSVSGRPLVLLHSINAAASSYDMRPLFLHYRQQRPVYALDLPGYGFSERTKRPYSSAFFTDTLVEFLSEIIGETADVIALSLTSEFAARIALERPELIHSLTMISPSGLGTAEKGQRVQGAEQAGFGRNLYGILSSPIWDRPLFDLIASKRSIRFFLGQSFVGQVTPGYVEYCYATAHQPGAQHVPFYFLSGSLFSPNILADVYQHLDTPTLIIYDQDAYVSFTSLDELLASNVKIQTARITPTRGLPHFEQLDNVCAALDQFWQDLA